MSVWDRATLDVPFEHIDPAREGMFSWQRVFSHREDIPDISASGRRVCVVGGGIAGLVAAYELNRRGCDVTVLEATDRFGGRVHTHYFADGSYGELGAMRIPLMHSAVLDYVEEFGLATRPFIGQNSVGRYHVGGISGSVGIVEHHEAGSGEAQYAQLRRAFPNLRQVDPEGLVRGPRWLLQKLLIGPIMLELGDDADKWALLASGTMRSSKIGRLWDARLADYAVGTEVGMTLDDWRFISRATGIACLEQCSVRQFILDMVPTLMSPASVEIVGGMEGLPQALLRRLGSSETLLNTKVESVSVSGSGVWVQARRRRGEMLRRSFDFALITIPPNELTSVRLESPLSIDAKLHAIERTRMGGLAKTLLYFSERFWEIGTPAVCGGLSFSDLASQQCWYPSDNASRFRDVAGLSRYRVSDWDRASGRGVLTAAYRWGQGAEDFARLHEQARARIAVSDLAKMHQVGVRFVEERLLEAVHKYWSGGFTYFDDRHRDLVTPLRGADGTARVFFAGEHIGPMHGWIVGAALSALAAVKGIGDAICILPHQRSGDSHRPHSVRN